MDITRLFLKNKKTSEIPSQQAPLWSMEQSLAHALMDSDEDAIIVYRPDFEVIYFNKAGESIFSLSSQLVIGKKMTLDQVKNFSSQSFAQVMFTTLAPTVVRRSDSGTYPYVVDVSLTDPKKEFRITTHHILDDRGVVCAFVKIVRDRTREIELLKAKSDFITIIAHQLRTPATALQWAMETLTQDASLTPSNKEIVKTSRETTEQLLKIINDLISAAQIEEGRFGYAFQDIVLETFINSLLLKAEHVARQYHVTLYFERPKIKGLTVRADAVQLGVVLSNLLDNAIKYNVDNGQVVVAIKKVARQPFVQVSVKDTGIGISTRDQEKLFTKFYRINNSEKTPSVGSGLGLYISKNIIERHGGTIWVESEPRRGTTLYFTLPIKS